MLALAGTATIASSRETGLTTFLGSRRGQGIPAAGAEAVERAEAFLAAHGPAFGLTWVADVPDPDSFLASLFATDGVYNLFAYSNPEADSLLAVGSEMRSSLDRAEVYRRAERIILEEVPVIPLFHIANNFAVRADVEGLLVTPFGQGNLTLERVWLRAPAS